MQFNLCSGVQTLKRQATTGRYLYKLTDVVFLSQTSSLINPRTTPRPIFSQLLHMILIFHHNNLFIVFQFLCFFLYFLWFFIWWWWGVKCFICIVSIEDLNLLVEIKLNWFIIYDCFLNERIVGCFGILFHLTRFFFWV